MDDLAPWGFLSLRQQRRVLLEIGREWHAWGGQSWRVEGRNGCVVPRRHRRALGGISTQVMGYRRCWGRWEHISKTEMGGHGGPSLIGLPKGLRE